MNARRILRQVSAGFLAGASVALAFAAPNPVALELVALTRLQEREVEAIRFMLEVSPLELPPHTWQCMLSRSAPAFTDYFANVFSRSFTDSELREAVAFFSSTKGASAVAAQRSMATATSGESYGSAAGKCLPEVFWAALVLAPQR